MPIKVGWAGTQFAPLHCEHVVQLYRDDRELVDALCDYFADAIQSPQQGVLFVATRAHCNQLRAALAKGGLDVPAAVATGKLTFLRVEDAMPKFMNGGRPDPGLFNDLINAVMDRCQGDGRYQHVHVFGEIVDVLWRTGNAQGTLVVEQLWNALRKVRPFSLYCAFHSNVPAKEALTGPMREILGAHSHVMEGAGGATVAGRGVFVELAELTQTDAEDLAANLRGLSPAGVDGR